MQLNIHNVDDLIFSNKSVQKEVPHLKHLFDQWLLGTKVPALRFLAQKSRLELLEQIDTDDNRAILNRYFKESITVQTMDYHVAKHYTLPLNEAENTLGEITDGLKNFCISRDADRVYLSQWR